MRKPVNFSILTGVIGACVKDAFKGLFKSSYVLKGFSILSSSEF